MSFDISRTPTLEAVATEDEQRLAQDLQKRVDEAIRAAESQDDALEAVGAHREAEDRLAKLRKAERTLTALAKASRQHAAAAAEAVLGGVIESAISGEKPDFKKLSGLAAMDSQNAITMRAIERLVEESIPLAQIASLREEAHALMTRARAAERIAQQRVEKILGQMRDAVTDEMVLPIDLSKGVSGALLAHAGALKKMAVQISSNADALERSYAERGRR
jgi:hypothetical protein